MPVIQPVLILNVNFRSPDGKYLPVMDMAINYGSMDFAGVIPNIGDKFKVTDSKGVETPACVVVERLFHFTPTYVEVTVIVEYKPAK